MAGDLSDNVTGMKTLLFMAHEEFHKFIISHQPLFTKNPKTRPSHDDDKTRVWVNVPFGGDGGGGEFSEVPQDERSSR